MGTDLSSGGKEWIKQYDLTQGAQPIHHIHPQYHKIVDFPWCFCTFPYKSMRIKLLT